MTLADRDRVFTNLYGALGADLSSARRRGDWDGTGALIARGRDALLDEVRDSGLRGRGGAGFPTALKWSFMPKEGAADPDSRPSYLVVNADESEPGTCKDRDILRHEPHKLVEGCLLSGFAIGARCAWVYVRGEFCREAAALQRAVDEAYDAGLLGKDAAGSGIEFDVRLHRGAGAYICGEETALLESLEGKRGLPRHRPPFPAQAGLFGRPTLIHNVETLFWLRPIIEQGGEAFAARGANGGKGLRAWSVSGRVRDPGVKIAPAGVSARELIESHCGGMAPGHAFKAWLPGGASGGLLPARLADLPLDFGALDDHGCFVGAGAVVVLSDRDSVRDVVRNLMRFFEDESCGQCTPCRVGTEKARALMDREVWDAPLLRELGAAMADASICGLGQAAPNPLLCALRHFPEELRA